MGSSQLMDSQLIQVSGLPKLSLITAEDAVFLLMLRNHIPVSSPSKSLGGMIRPSWENNVYI